MPYSAECKDRMLASQFLAAALFVGLLEGEEEVADAAYRREPLTMGRPSGDGAERRLENLEEVRFIPFRDFHDGIDGFVIADASGLELAREPLPARMFDSGDAAFFAPGALRVRLAD